MATNTTHYNLIKPTMSDSVDVRQLNTNSDNIDSIMYANEIRSTTAIENTADEYDTTQNYTVGDIAIYDNALYKCTGVTTGTWDPSKWERSTIAALIDEVVTDLATKQDALTEGDHIDISSNVVSVDTTDSIDHVSKTVSGDIISITDGGDGFPVENLTINIDPVQSGSGDPSPDNVRPITGWTEANVTRCGKNFFGTTSIKIPSGRPGYASVTTNNSGLTAEAYVLLSGTYTISVKGGNRFGVCVTDKSINDFANNEAINLVYSADRSGEEITYYTYTLTVNNPCYISAYFTNNTSTYPLEHYQLELGSTATTYEPYNGTTYNIDWQTEASTVYGGTLDVTSGVLTVDKANIASYAGETINEPWLSSMDVYESGATPTTGAQVVYTLSTPLAYNLTSTEVTTLLGNNTLWADTGDSTLVYNTDTDNIIPTSEAVVDYVAPTKAVADSIKCTETTAGTYTLSATVDVDGNVTYAWS